MNGGSNGSADRLLAGLDPHQRHAVATSSTLVAVMAAAGSGKTRVLTRRIAYRIATETADARHTLALTFTREAAGELRRRLRRVGLREPVEAGTFHSIALALLRQRAADVDRRPPTILNDPDRLLAEIAGDVGIQVLVAERGWLAAHGRAASAYAAIAKAAGRRPGAPLDAIGAALERYEQLKHRRGVVDLDDLITTLGNELLHDAEFAAGVRWRFRHVLVDEAQDLNPAQHRLLEAIVGGRNDLFLVGDPAQSIYGFNGADPSLLTDIDHQLPGVEVIRLPVNYRCTPQIVAAGRQVLAAVGSVPDTVSGRESGIPIEFVMGDDEYGEADRVVVIVQALPQRSLRHGEVAILGRTHGQLALLRKALERDGVAMRRNALAAGTPLAATLREAAALPSPSRLRAWAHDIVDDPPTPGLADEAATAERRVASAVLDFLRDVPLGDGAAFRSWVASTGPFAEATDDEGVELLTFHAAKGREWPTVVVTGVESSLVPHRTATTVDARAEEARLLHVAITRASDRLVITRAARRRGYARQPSPFIAGLHDVLAAVAVVSAAVPLPAVVAEQVGPHGEDGLVKRRVDALTRWRAGVARASALLPQQVCSDTELRSIATTPPMTAGDLSALTGFGPATAARHLDPIRSALDSAASE